MPEYIPRPYVRQADVPDTRTLMDLMRLAGAARAETAGRKGQLAANNWINLGELVQRSLSSYRADQDRNQALTQRQAEADRDEQFRRDQLASVDADRVERRQLAEQAARDKQQADAYRRGGEIAEQVEYGPIDESQVDDVMAGPAAGRARYVFGPGTSDGPELQPTPSQRRGIETEQAIKGMGGMIGPNGQVIMPPKVEAPPTPESRLSGEDLLAYLAAQGNEGAKRALEVKRAQRPPANPNVRQPIWVVGANGEFLDLAGVAPPGAKPANTREQGRAVTSGDAGRIADLDTSLTDLSELANTLQETKDATGVMAQAGAALWNPITNLTGWGVDAKKRQGVIDRVKQVIGKALEGGVLRKEDEIKYAKILPTIGDAPEVAASKLNGLRDALIQRRQTTLDSLSDAGYDVTKFKQRPGGKTDDPVDALIKKYGGG